MSAPHCPWLLRSSSRSILAPPPLPCHSLACLPTPAFVPLSPEPKVPFLPSSLVRIQVGFQGSAQLPPLCICPWVTHLLALSTSGTELSKPLQLYLMDSLEPDAASESSASPPLPAPELGAGQWEECELGPGSSLLRGHLGWAILDWLFTLHPAYSESPRLPPPHLGSGPPCMAAH